MRLGHELADDDDHRIPVAPQQTILEGSHAGEVTQE